MLNYLWSATSERKLRLYGCAACRRIWELMDAASRGAVVASEQFADGLISEEQLDLRSAAAEETYEDAVIDNDDLKAHVTHAASYSSSPSLALHVLAEALDAILPAAPGGATEECAAQADLLRDIFGNPFRPIAINPAWLTSDVLALARGIYDERAFDRMPILADALQDAGCDNIDVLNHCRGDGLHVRGCWVVDMVLGKA
ncbi:hypothetical protein [Frigoriglobus tundricola]|nr:hypothetical protein [Frigoriglobus tundricola]